jgi:hypothetical protein
MAFNVAGKRGVSSEGFIQTFNRFATANTELTERERASIDIFNGALFQRTAETRLLMLVMAVEALLEFTSRPPESVALVRSFITSVQESSGLDESEKNSLLSALRFLKNESIRRAGRRLAEERLAGKTYDGRSGPQLFIDCYDLRSQLVHGGDIRKARDQSGRLAGQLEVFVSDLITFRFSA